MKWDKLTAGIVSVVILLLFTTVFVHLAEGWNLVDSFYFAGMTMTTIGHADLIPTRDVTKIVITLDAIIFVFAFLYTLTVLGKKV